MTASAKLAEIAREVGDLERAHETLIAIVRAKLTGEPNPDAWQDAIAIEEASRPQPGGRSETLRCPECRKILNVPDAVSSADGQSVFVDCDPIMCDCGPTHVLTYASYTIEIDDDGARLRPTTKVEVIPFPKDP